MEKVGDIYEENGCMCGVDGLVHVIEDRTISSVASYTLPTKFI